MQQVLRFCVVRRVRIIAQLFVRVESSMIHFELSKISQLLICTSGYRKPLAWQIWSRTKQLSYVAHTDIAKHYDNDRKPETKRVS